MVSLGISVCQGLLKYYESHKQSGSTVGNMYSQLLSLTRTLTLIEGVVGRSLPDVDENARSQLMESIECCRSAAATLEKKLKKIESSHADGTSSVKKAAFPFRESTLVRLKEIMIDFRSELTLVMEVLQLWVDPKRVGSANLYRDASAISLRLDGIEGKLEMLAEDAAISTASVLEFGQDIEVISDVLSSNQIDEKQRIHEWLQPPDPFTSHTAARSKHETSTNQWLFESLEFLEWLNEGRPLLLL